MGFKRSVHLLFGSLVTLLIAVSSMNLRWFPPVAAWGVEVVVAVIWLVYALRQAVWDKRSARHVNTPAAGLDSN